MTSVSYTVLPPLPRAWVLLDNQTIIRNEVTNNAYGTVFESV